MQTMWVRDDGRWYCCCLGADLLGVAVMIWYGGHQVARTRTVPVENEAAGERMIEALSRRRERHGYRRQFSAGCRQ